MPASRAKQAEVAARRARVVSLRAGGLSYAAIAKEVGLPTAGRAREDLQRALRERLELDGRDRELLVALELERLDGVERAVQVVMGRARQAGEDQLLLRAADRLLRIAERRSMLLGLDAGDKPRGANDGDSFDQAIRDLYAEMGDSPAL